MTASLQLVGLTLAVGLLMILSGLQKRRLEWKTQRRRCPSCRQDTRDCICRR